jgi:translation initiation factor 2B subunit (eIF-2B alpha/beta/delta family)
LLLTLVDAIFRVAGGARSPGGGASAVARVVARHGERLATAPAEAAARLVRRLPARARVVTLSSSEMVARALCEAQRRHGLDEVVIAESLPGGEGRHVARRLAAAGIAVRLVPDALAPGMVASADAVVAGADAITSRALWNKCGTLGLALAARAARRPMLVVTATDRLVGRALASRLANVPVAWGRGAGVGTAARLFEPVPLALVAYVLTERNAFRPGLLARRLAHAGAARWWTRPPR